MPRHKLTNRLEFWTSDTNCHGTQAKGEAWNQQTVRGPKFKVLRLERKSVGTSLRFIFYFPSGAWWHLDYYSPMENKDAE